MKKIVVAILLVSGFVVGWKVLQKPKVDQPSVQAKDEVYTNSTYGYSFNYPTNWEAPLEDGIVGQSSHVSVYNLRTTQALYNEGINKVDERGKKDIVWTMAPITIYTNKLFSKSVRLEDLVKENCGNGEVCDWKNAQDITIGGIDGKKYVKYPPSGAVEVIFIRWPYSYRIVYRKDEQTRKLFDEQEVESVYNLVITSFQF